MLAHLRAPCAARAPELSPNADASVGTARLHHDRIGADQAFGAGDGTPALREPDPEPALADLEGHGGEDGHEAPRRREDEEREQDRDPDGQGGSITAT